MAKLGCSLKEAFGESWNAGPRYYQAPPERFRVMDPYSTNTGSLMNSGGRQDNFEQIQAQRIKTLEAKVANLTAPLPRNDENFTNLNDIMQAPGLSNRIDNVVRFSLVSILFANLMDLLNTE